MTYGKEWVKRSYFLLQIPDGQEKGQRTTLSHILAYLFGVEKNNILWKGDGRRWKVVWSQWLQDINWQVCFHERMLFDA